MPAPWAQPGHLQNEAHGINSTSTWAEVPHRSALSRTEQGPHDPNTSDTEATEKERPAPCPPGAQRMERKTQLRAPRRLFHQKGPGLLLCPKQPRTPQRNEAGSPGTTQRGLELQPQGSAGPRSGVSLGSACLAARPPGPAIPADLGSKAQPCQDSSGRSPITRAWPLLTEDLLSLKIMMKTDTVGRAPTPPPPKTPAHAVNVQGGCLLL